MSNDLYHEVVSLRKEIAELKILILEKTLLNQDVSSESKEQSLDERIVSFLHELNVSSRLKGYQFLREAIKNVYEDFGLIGAFTTVLYPGIAKKYQTIPQRVERAIRHAIESSYERNYHHSFYQLNFKSRKPTNSQFIADIADHLLREDNSKSEVM